MASLVVTLRAESPSIFLEKSGRGIGLKIEGDSARRVCCGKKTEKKRSCCGRHRFERECEIVSRDCFS